jgi:putative methionine-R-sulfoxide reductase with GAF domain
VTRADRSLLAAVRREATGADPPEERARRIVDLIRLHTGRRWVGVYRVDAGEVTNLAWSGPAAPAYPGFPADRGLTGDAIRSRSTVVSNDVTNDPRYLTALETTGSELIVPVVAGSRVVGTLDVEDERTGAFDRDDRALFESLAAALTGLYTEPSSAMSRPLRTRLPDSAHTCRPWRIHALTRDFRLEDVWALPTSGGSSDFHRLVQLMVSLNPSRGSAVVRTLFAIRWKIGALLGWDAPDDGHAERPTLRSRLPADLRDRPSGPDARPFASLYLTDDEWAAEIANRTVHGVLHLGWVDDGTGGYRGQMAVLVKPHGLLGTGYMAAITPFRRLLVYPRMLREIEREWQAGADEAAPRSKPL